MDCESTGRYCDVEEIIVSLTEVAGEYIKLETVKDAGVLKRLSNAWGEHKRKQTIEYSAPDRIVTSGYGMAITYSGSDDLLDALEAYSMETKCREQVCAVAERQSNGRWKIFLHTEHGVQGNMCLTDSEGISGFSSTIDPYLYDDRQMYKIMLDIEKRTPEAAYGAPIYMITSKGPKEFEDHILHVLWRYDQRAKAILEQSRLAASPAQQSGATVKPGPLI